ncbi:MAG: hypothetical protein JRG90_18020 [Deltaproteobacteria bacterium]|nr:hypothetical protein [Deltaproteobacteria bacterium]
MRFSRIVFVLTALAFLTAAPAQATSCGKWDRMGAGQKSATIDRMIESVISGSGGRQYHVDRGAIGRCLWGYAQSIEYDFDAACADSRSAGMQALNGIFKEYVWSCAG